jgi:Flp pilus assembly protein TadD
VRIEATRLLAPAAAAVREFRADVWGAALAEYEEVQRALAGQPGSQINLGRFDMDLGRPGEAETVLREAIRLDPRFVPAYVNLADLQRLAPGGEAAAEGTLREGLRVAPGAPALHHALGLSLVRQERKEEALASLRRAAQLAPDDARYGYVVAVALHGLDRSGEALQELNRLRTRHPGDRDILLTLASLRREAGDAAGAERLLRELAAINPGDPALLSATSRAD